MQISFPQPQSQSPIYSCSAKSSSASVPRDGLSSPSPRASEEEHVYRYLILLRNKPDLQLEPAVA